MSLDNVPQHVKLAIDLIQLLEENQLDAKTVLKALAIVNQDFKTKLANSLTEES